MKNIILYAIVKKTNGTTAFWNTNEAAFFPGMPAYATWYPVESYAYHEMSLYAIEDAEVIEMRGKFYSTK